MQLSRRKFLSTAAIGSAVLALRSPGAADPAPAVMTDSKTSPRPIASRPARPNLLLLWTDQHRNDTLPSSGNTVIRAPNLGALADRSFVFSQAYCGQPVCTPSRGCILTGLLPHNHGAIQNNIPLPRKVKTIAEYLPPDFLTGYFGKWHLGSEITAQHGFREWISIEDKIYRDFYANPEDKKLRSSYHHFLWNNGFPPDDHDDPNDGAFYTRTMAAAMSQQFTKSGFLANEAERFLRERRDGQPFVLSVNTLEPHPPTYGPFNDRYDLPSLPTGPAFGRPVGADASRLHRSTWETYHKKGYDTHSLSNEWDLRRLRANYYGQVSMVDGVFGRILRALEESGQADNTIVVYTSDHGDMLGDHCLMQKSVFYEQAERIPLMIHVPWLSNRQVRFDGPISQVDLMPTLLDLLGCEVPTGLDGRSRAGVLAAPSSWQPANIMVEWHDDTDKGCDGRSIVTTDGWKLNLFRGDRPELYDLNSDPVELRNLGSDPAQQDRIRRLSAEIHSWQELHRDKLPLVTA